MRWIVRSGFAVILSAALITVFGSFAGGKTSDSSNKSTTIIVEIDYGSIRSSRTVEAPRVNGRTALEILQSVATVKTHPVEQYIFVVSIDGVEGKRGEMGWYYEVDNKPADKLASLNIINGAKQVRWVYKKDVCSEKVDGRI